MHYDKWQETVLNMIQGSMIYGIDLRRMYKAGMAPEEAVKNAREAKLIHKRGTSEAPAPILYKGGRPRLLGGKRKPLWELAYIQAKIKSAIFAILAEAETHRLEPDAIAYVRDMKRKLLE